MSATAADDSPDPTPADQAPADRGPADRGPALRLRSIALAAGPAAFAIALLLSPLELGGMPRQAAVVAGLTAWMAAWWLTECIPIAITSLIPLAALPLLGILDSKATSAAYGNRVNLLLMSGFMLAMAIEKWHLHRRIALSIVTRFADKPASLLLGFMIATALSSMWVSNTATTLMMLPIALACVSTPGRRSPVAPAFILGVAYAASLGGLGTPIGTPANLICIAQLQALEQTQLSFLDWMKVGVPVVALILPLIWLTLCGLYRLGPFKPRDDTRDLGLGSRGELAAELAALGPMSAGEARAAALFGVTALLWIFRAPLPLGDWTIPGWSALFPDPGAIHDSTVAALMVVIMGFWPVSPDDPDPARHRVLDWDSARRIPWGLVLLFGGGIALAGGFEASGLSAWIGDRLELLTRVPTWAMVLGLCLTVTFLTEVTSNTAVATLMMPILAVTARETGASAPLLMVPAALSASCAFMFPVATAPNAIAYGTGEVSIAEMARAGALINIGGAIAIAALSLAIL